MRQCILLQAWIEGIQPRQGNSFRTAAGCDVQEGADETDEGGGKRLLRSHTAAAAADLDRENSVDRTKWSG